MKNMICRLFRRVRDLPFSTKLIAVYVFSLLLGIGLNTYEQIDNSLERPAVHERLHLRPAARL